MRPLTDDARIVELNRLEEQAKKNIQRTHSIYFEGENHNLPVFKVDINFPLFRMENGRTKRKQLEFIHQNPSRKHELDDGSTEAAQKIQLAILQEMASEADLLELLKQGQHEPLLLRNDGYVVNGNRRLAAMRLLHSDPQKYKSSADFSYVDVARLPLLNEKEIRRIEQRLQMSQDGKADYNWVDELLTIQSNIDDFGMTIDELAKDMNKQKRTIANQQLMLVLIDEYLTRLNEPGQYFKVEGDEQAFKTLAQCFTKYDSQIEKQLQLLDLSFAVIYKNQAGESKHNRIRKIADNLSTITAKTFEIGPELSHRDVSTGQGDILDSVPPRSQPSAQSLSLDSETSDKVHEAIRAFDREKDLQDRANGPSEAVQQAATLLKNIRITSSMTKIKQFRGQLKAIRTMCDELLDQLENSSIDVDQ